MLQVKTIETVMNLYLTSCQEIPLRLDSERVPHHEPSSSNPIPEKDFNDLRHSGTDRLTRPIEPDKDTQDQIKVSREDNGETISAYLSSKEPPPETKSGGRENERSPEGGVRSRARILELFFTSVQQLSCFSQKLSVFSKISPTDQEKLLRAAVLEMCLVMSGFSYDCANNCWPDASLARYQNQGVILNAHDLNQMMNPDLFEKHMSLTRGIKDMKLDEVSLMILCVIILLSPDRTGLQNPLVISKEQENYLLLLRNYMNWRFGEHISRLLYPRLLLKLPDLRELADVLTDHQINLCREEMQEVQLRLKNLNLISPSGSMASSPTSSSSSYSSSSGESMSSGATASSFLSSGSSPAFSWCFKRDALAPYHHSPSSISCQLSPSSSLSSSMREDSFDGKRQQNKLCSISSAGEDDMSTSSSSSEGSDERQPSSPD